MAVVERLDAMPDPVALRRVESRDTHWVLHGSRVLFAYDPADTGMRHLAIVALSDTLGWGRIGEVAQLFGVTPEHVSRLRTQARTHGSAGLVRRMGRPAKLTDRQVRQARAWAGQAVPYKDIASRLGVHPSQVTRLLRRHGPLPTQDELDLGTPDTGEPTAADGEPQPPPGQGTTTDAVDGEPQPPPGPGTSTDAVDADVAAGGAGTSADTVDTTVDADGAAGVAPTAGARAQAPVPPRPARLLEGVFWSRYAGASLLHAFYDRIDAAGVLGGAAVAANPTYDDLAVLTATSLAFVLGASTVEQTKHLPRAELGVLAGLGRMPELRTLRPRLAAVADACDPLGLQRGLATAMLHADAPYLPLYFVDDHFLPYEGDKPVAKGWNTKRRHAQKGHADTPVIDYRGRVVCFTTGEPSGLSVTLPHALDQLRAVVGPDATIMVGFDRGGSYPKVFTACRTANVGWLTYRRGELAPITTPPQQVFLTRPDATTEAVSLADETITLDGYGECRQITLFEHGVARLQILTSDTTAPASALLAWLRCRWRIENVIKYLVQHLGVDAICDYRADLVPNTAKVDNPARKQAKAEVKTAKQRLADAERALAQLLNSDLDVAATNNAIPHAQHTITTAKQDLADAEQRLKPIPAKVPANTLDPDAQRALLHTSRRTLQMVLRLLAYNAELWLADHLNTYLRDNDEFRAATRNLLHLGGTITYTPTTITVTLDQPATPKLTNALCHVLDQLNTIPPHMPGDPRPITYQLTQN